MPPFASALREKQTRLQCIHEHIARQVASGEPSARRFTPQLERRRVRQIRDLITSILADQESGLCTREITAGREREAW
jgi:hypothetical protein